jgi:hypothetical protein
MGWEKELFFKWSVCPCLALRQRLCEELEKGIKYLIQRKK